MHWLVVWAAGSLTFKLDIGNDGTWDWQTTQNVTDTATLTSPNLAAAFNRYWAAHGAPANGQPGCAGQGLCVQGGAGFADQSPSQVRGQQAAPGAHPCANIQ